MANWMSVIMVNHYSTEKREETSLQQYGGQIRYTMHNKEHISFKVMTRLTHLPLKTPQHEISLCPGSGWVVGFILEHAVPFKIFSGKIVCLSTLVEPDNGYNWSDVQLQ